MLGTTISHYEILRELGAGGMGVVYEAEDTRLRRNVALKFLSVALAQDAPMLERFEREARAASALNHPGICTVHAIEQDGGRTFIVMELVDGESLAARLAGRPMEIGPLLDLGIQMADALEAAHAKGVVHRDLKPMNMMVTSRGQVKILDFGLAKFDHNELSALTATPTAPPRGADLTAAGTVFGTVQFMSPEQARGLATDARTDLFSLGAILYQMATGDRAFEGDTQAVVFDAILNREPRPLEDSNPAMPASLGPILEKALEKDRGLRYQTATELKTDLLRLRRKLEGHRSGPASAADSKAPAPRAQRSIAVLYFENLSGVKEDEYLRDGITEDILTDLSKIKGLNVFPRTTVLAFRDQKSTAADISRQLRADFALEGSLRRAGNRLRINAQLVDAATGFPVWSERYDREMSDIFAVQDEIAHKIAEALRIKLTPQEQAELAAKPTENLQAYDLYLRGRSYARRRTTRGHGFRPPDVRERRHAGSELRPRLGGDRERLRPCAVLVRARRDVHGTRPVGIAARGGARAGHPRGARLPGLDPLCRQPVRRRRPPDAGRDLAKARLRGRVLPSAAGAVRLRQVRGARVPRRAGDRGGGHRLQRLHSAHECPRRTRSGGGAPLGPAAAHPDLRKPPSRSAGRREGPDPLRGHVRAGGAHRRRRPRDDPGDDAAGRTKPRSSTTPPAPSPRSTGAPTRSRRCAKPGKPATGTPSGRAAIPTWRASTTIRSSKSSTPRPKKRPSSRKPESPLVRLYWSGQFSPSALARKTAICLRVRVPSGQ